MVCSIFQLCFETMWGYPGLAEPQYIKVILHKKIELMLRKEEKNPIIGAGLSILLTVQKYHGPNCCISPVLPI
jgi:hypothetical protein